MSETKNQDSTYEIRSHTVAEMKDLLIEMKGKNEDKKWQEKAQELEKELKSLKKNKNYGLFWKEKPEEFEKKTKDSLPILEEIPELAIKQDETLDNIIIEGDNYHTLSVLSYTHRRQVDMIYIDPPYNTGNKDFVYNDRYVDKEDDFRHSKWLSFMEKRLKLAKELLKETGVIFISIDDNEQAQLKLLCDEIFGEENFIGNLVWLNREWWWGSDSKHFKIKHEYILVYWKNKENLIIPWLVQTEDKSYNYQDEFIEERWKYKLIKLNSSSLWYIKSLDFWIFWLDWKEYFPNEWDEKVARWRWSKKKVAWGLENSFVVFKDWNVYTKQYFKVDNEDKPIVRTEIPTWAIDIFSSTMATKQLDDIFWCKAFSYSKPYLLVKYLIEILWVNFRDSLILDFFAGSGTTGHAVLALNKEDGGNRRFILCSNRENTSEFPDRNICRDITYERVKRVATGYVNTKSEQIAGLGGNVRYLRTDFIPKHKGTDNIRNRMVERCSEMLCLRENIWEIISPSPLEGEGRGEVEMRFYQRGDKYLAILFGLFRFEEFCQVLRTFDKPVAIYVFSRGQMTRDDFEGMAVPYTVEEIPDPILAVYKTIFWL